MLHPLMTQTGLPGKLTLPKRQRDALLPSSTSQIMIVAYPDDIIKKIGKDGGKGNDFEFGKGKGFGGFEQQHYDVDDFLGKGLKAGLEGGKGKGFDFAKLKTNFIKTILNFWIRQNRVQNHFFVNILSKIVFLHPNL